MGILLEDVEAPLSICSSSGVALAASAQGFALLQRIGGLSELPSKLPAGLWDALNRVPPGNAVEWRPPSNAQTVLGCTRYRAGAGHLLLMNEITDKRAELSGRLHRQRLESTGRLVASIAHELRNSVASILYSADYLSLACADLPPEMIRDTAREMVAASRRLQFTVDGLLDYARLGPTVSVPVSLSEVLTRAQGFLRSVYRKDTHNLEINLEPAADWVRGNSLTIEQIFINLLLNAAEAAEDVVRVSVTSELAAPNEDGTVTHVRIEVRDEGEGIPEPIRTSIFEPFFTTRDNATGLGLTTTREAAESLGGSIAFEPGEKDTCFVLLLRRGDNP